MASRDEIDNMAPMVRWFDPSVLLKILRPVLISGIFGTYADRRLMQAALDNERPEVLLARTDIRGLMKPSETGEAWFDFIADTGDGFDSTYSIAWLEAQPDLEVDGEKTKRGPLLVLGGDQVYPDATLENYTERFKKLFEWALPDDGTKEEDKPRLYAIPGNHDWYDGLDLFLAFFCKKDPWKIGNWRSHQRRSYFALRLTDDLWIWGVDIQLSERVDQPQAEYFRMVASEMPKGSTIIVATAVPGWYAPTEDGFGCLGYFNRIAREAGRQLRIALVLSGDVHHYARYQAADGGTQFITAGGGGAFLHPTHTLKETVHAYWNGRMAKLTLGMNAKDGSEACFPPKTTSRWMVLQNLAFAFLNLKFTGLMGLLYSVAGLTTLMWSDPRTFGSAITNLPFLFWSAAFALMFVGYGDRAEWNLSGRKWAYQPGPTFRCVILGGLHALAHAVALGLLSSSVYGHLVSWDFEFWTWGFNLTYLPAMFVAGGLVGATVLGVYLTIGCLALGACTNDAFSSQSLSSYKNFLRIRVGREKVTVYPIGLKEVGKRRNWQPRKADDKSSSQVIPANPLAPHLIEPPIDVLVPPVPDPGPPPAALKPPELPPLPEPVAKT